MAAYLLVRDLFGQRAGLAAAAAYLLAPYLAYDVLYRGNLAESVAFIWPPLVLWGLRRLGRGRATSLAAFGEVAFVALPFAALVLTHNIFAFIAAPLFVAYALLLSWQAHDSASLGFGRRISRAGGWIERLFLGAGFAGAQPGSL